MGEKTLFSRRAPLLAGRAPCLLTRAWSRVKRVPFHIRTVPSLAKRCPYNTFGEKINHMLRYSTNGDKNWHPWAFGTGAPVSIGDGLLTPEAAPGSAPDSNSLA